MAKSTVTLLPGENASAMRQASMRRERLSITAKHLLNEFPFALADGVAGMPRRAAIDRAARLLRRDMRRDASDAHGLDKRALVIAFVGPDRGAAADGRPDHQQGCVSERSALFCASSRHQGESR